MLNFKCGDCGEEVKERKRSSRPNVCDGCWDNRGWLLDNRAKIDPAVFQAIQRSMAYRRGTAKRKIEVQRRRLEP